ncbi:unnamed protein product [Brachionus calyciflorus]|uniref:Alpha-type protein kinase domain-containing protein n=1 Tax=Brachionus calyciflorus TaxID=104777 RepID=A0A814FLH9_9BILA|nr:unnamed protein product [Brachionus calyciflorus]
MFKITNFETISIKTIKSSSVSNIRSELVNFPWRSDSISFVFNYPQNLNSINWRTFNFFYYMDGYVQKLLDHREIYLIRSKKNLLQISSKTYLHDLILNARLSEFNRKVAVLKRINLKQFTDIQQALIRCDVSKKHNFLALKTQYFESFKKSTLLGSIELKKQSIDPFRKVKDYFNSSYGIFLDVYERKVLRSRSNIFYWVEIFESQEILNQILDINLTAGFVVDEFNKKYIDWFRVPTMIQIKYQDYIIGALKMNLEIEKSEISFGKRSAILDCLTHFSYEYSKKQFILKDLRPLNENDKILLTEPVIFSCFSNRFGSSDMGEKAINKFKDEHECTHFCLQLKLSKLK